MHVVLRIGALAVAGALQAQGISSLIAATLAAPPVLESALPPVVASTPAEKSAASILARNPFEHATPPLVVDDAMTCEGVRALVTVRGETEDDSLVALDVGGTRLLRKRGGEAGNMHVAWIGTDRVWLSSADRTCEARVFVHPEPKKTPTSEAPKGIAKTSATEWQIERSTLDRLLDTPAELAKVRVVPEPGGVRVVKVPPNSALAALGIEDGDRIVSAAGVEVTSPEKILELYARLKTGTLPRVSIAIVRKGQPMTLDYVVR
jgi:general secretion pathway protein C